LKTRQIVGKLSDSLLTTIFGNADIKMMEKK